MLVPHLGDLGRGRHGGRGGGGRYWGGYYPLYAPAYQYQELEEEQPIKYAVFDTEDKLVTVVSPFPQGLPPGYKVRQATAAEIVKAAGGTISGLGRFRRPGRGGHRRGYYPYYMPAYYYQQTRPQPKYAIINPAGKVVAIVTGVPTALPKGFTFRPATVAEVVQASTGTVSGLEEGEESVF